MVLFVCTALETIYPSKDWVLQCELPEKPGLQEYVLSVVVSFLQLFLVTYSLKDNKEIILLSMD